MKKKYKLPDFNLKKKQLLISFMHISSSISLAVFYFFGNEEKLVALLVNSSFRRVACSGIRNSSVATSSISWIRQAVLKWERNTESLRIQHSTAARYSNRIEDDVTRLVATEHVRKKCSLWKLNLLQLSHGTCSSNLIESNALNCHCCHRSQYLHWKGGFISNN